MLNIKNLHTSIKKEPILNGIDLNVAEGEIHTIMGKNGCGKSTLLNTIMGGDQYKIDKGIIEFDGHKLNGMDTTDRAKLGLFLSFQTPYEFFEATTLSILTRVWNINHETKGSSEEFYMAHKELLTLLEISDDMLEREFNVGFSGGERKRLEVLQLLMIKPKMIMLDEIDTGLDIDSVIAIGNTLSTYQKDTKATVIFVTHLSNFLKYLSPNKVHVMAKGVIVKTGGVSLAERINEEGYSFIK